MKIKQFIAVLMASALPTLAVADFPEKPITLIVAYGAGGGTDVTARLLARDLESAIGQPVTVQNVTGGGGWNGWGSIADAKPDGYTIGYINIPNMYAGYLDPEIGRPYNLDSFTPLMNHVTDYSVWAVRQDSPYTTVEEVIEAAKSEPGSVSFAAHGAGGDDHLALLAMQSATDAEFKTIHNSSTSESISQVLGGFVDVVGGNVSEMAKSDLRVLGVMANERSEFLPDAPTFKEQGYDQVWSVSRGIAAPADLPDDIAAKIIGALEQTLASDAHRSAAAELALSPEVVQGEEYREFLVNTQSGIQKLMGW